MRLDTYLAERGMAQSRTRASELIKKGFVYINGRTATKPSAEVLDADTVKLESTEREYVSRAAKKLEHAKSIFKLEFSGLRAVDLGASTGGFCQILLEGGVSELYAIDIGHAQLHESIARDERVHVLEGVNARYIDQTTVGGKADIVTADLSFISQTLVFEAISRVLKNNGVYVGLIKPQFEAGREKLGKNGIIKDKKVHADVIERVIAEANEHGLVCMGLTPSPIYGGDGNREFLAYYINKGVRSALPDRKEIDRIAWEDGDAL